MESAAKKKNTLAMGVIGTMIVWASALLFSSAANASSASHVGQKSRAEVSGPFTAKSVELLAANPINATRYYDALEGVALECTVAPKGGFGVLGPLSRFEKGVPDETIGDFYKAVATSPLFEKKLQLANLVSGGRKISVDDVLLQLQSNSKFRLVSDLSKARLDVTSGGAFVFRHSSSTGLFSKATAHHELLHLAQFLRDPSLAAKAKKLGFLQRQLYEPIPALIGSPEIYGLPTLVATGTTVLLVYESAGLVFELIPD